MDVGISQFQTYQILHSWAFTLYLYFNKSHPVCVTRRDHSMLITFRQRCIPIFNITLIIYNIYKLRLAFYTPNIKCEMDRRMQFSTFAGYIHTRRKRERERNKIKGSPHTGAQLPKLNAIADVNTFTENRLCSGFSVCKIRIIKFICSSRYVFTRERVCMYGYRVILKERCVSNVILNRARERERFDPNSNWNMYVLTATVAELNNSLCIAIPIRKY